MYSPEELDALKKQAEIDNINTANMNLPARSEEEDSVSMREITFTDELNDVYNSFQGKVKQNDGSYKLENQARMNKQGADNLISGVKDVINKITALTKFGSNEIDARTIDFSQDMATKLAKNFKQWEINLAIDGETILQELETLFKAGLNKSEDALTMKARIKRVFETFMHNDQNNNKKPKGVVV